MNTVKKHSPAEIEITERRDDGQIEIRTYKVGELDHLLDEIAENGGWSPSYNRVQHAALNAWNAVRDARHAVRRIVLTFPE